VIEACQRLKAHGYQLALDDFTGAPDLDPLVGLADVIKIDLRLPEAERAFERVRSHQARGVRLLAEKVETHDEYAAARDRGYDYFQGYFFCRPEMVQGKDLPPTKLSALRFLGEICREDVSFERLEEIFKQ